jgi:hypothetical protein
MVRSLRGKPTRKRGQTPKGPAAANTKAQPGLLLRLWGKLVSRRPNR